VGVSTPVSSGDIDQGSVDSHAHWYPRSAMEFLVDRAEGVELVNREGGWSVMTRDAGVALQVANSMHDEAERLRALDAAGISLQVLSLGAMDMAWGGREAVSLARLGNEALAELCKTHRSRLRFLASIPLAEEESGTQELDRALHDGAVGVSLTTTHGGRDLSDPEFAWFWPMASSRGLSVAIHPCVPMGRSIGPGNAFLLSGFPSETTLAATRLVLQGTLAHSPGARVMWSHLGGALPMLIGRLDAGARSTGVTDTPPSEQLAQCWFDAVSVHPPAIRCARETFGASRLVFGTDTPHTLERPDDIISAIRESCGTLEMRGVLRSNAHALFPSLGVSSDAEEIP
jgi:predicted TIM-barrel fold metal-dependent hydrolase